LQDYEFFVSIFLFHFVFTDQPSALKVLLPNGKDIYVLQGVYEMNVLW